MGLRGSSGADEVRAGRDIALRCPRARSARGTNAVAHANDNSGTF